jgi:hypothetical protein
MTCRALIRENIALHVVILWIGGSVKARNGCWLFRHFVKLWLSLLIQYPGSISVSPITGLGHSKLILRFSWRLGTSKVIQLTEKFPLTWLISTLPILARRLKREASTSRMYMHLTQIFP